MKILQLSKYYSPVKGGLEVVAEFFSKAFVDLGHEVTVLSFGADDRAYTGKFDEKVLQAKEDLLLLSTPFSLSYLRALKKELTSGVDLIFVHLPNPFAHEILKFVKRFNTKPTRVIGVYHSDIVNQRYLRDIYNLHFLSDRSLYDGFICSSPQLKEFSPVLSKVKDKTTVIPFCVDALAEGLIRSPHHTFQGNFLAIGRLVPYKGFDFLIQSFKDLPYNLTIVGKGPLDSKLREMATANVTFMGEVSDEVKRELICTSDALIMSSINESEAYGMTIVESFSAGLPVIGSAIRSGVSFLLRDRQTGLTFPVKNQEALIKAIEAFATDSRLRSRLSKNGMEFYQTYLSYEAFRANVSGLLKKFDTRKPQPKPEKTVHDLAV